MVTAPSRRRPRVLLLSTTTGYQIRSFGEAAAALGVDLIIGSDRCDHLDDPWRDQAIPVRFHDESRSIDAILNAVAHDPPVAILAVGDRPAVLAAIAAEVLRLPGHPPAAAAASRHKLTARALMKAAGLPTPWFGTLSLSSDPMPRARSLPYPLVLKPAALSGSRGVMRVDDERALGPAFDRLKRILESPDVRGERDPAHDLALVESFIPGAEFAVEGLLDHGALRVLAIFDKPDPLDGPFFEETLYVTPSRAPQDVQAALAASVAAAARALGLHHGPVHAECRVSPGNSGTAPSVFVLEVAARPIGGLCARALRFSSPWGSMALEELLLRHAIGQDVAGCVRESDASGVMMIPIPRRGVYRKVDGVVRARKVPGIDDVRITAKMDALLQPLPEGRSYLGFIFARGGTPHDVERALRNAHAELTFTIDREIALTV